jgi:hypothetical protein
MEFWAEKGIKNAVWQFSICDTEARYDVLQPLDRDRFEQLVLPHLDSAFNLARWLLGDTTDADDVVQEAMLRAQRFFPASAELSQKLGCCKLFAVVATAGYKNTAHRN